MKLFNKKLEYEVLYDLFDDDSLDDYNHKYLTSFETLDEIRDDISLGMVDNENYN